MIQKLQAVPGRLRQIISFLVAIILIASVSYLGVRYYNSSKAATPGTIYVTPASGTWTPGSTVSVSVREESGTQPINSAQFFLNYNASHLQYVSLSEGEFNFPGSTSTGEAGIIRIHRGVSGGNLTGDRAIVTINFKVIASSGSTSLSIDKANSSLSGGDGVNILQTVTGGNYSIASSTTPPPPPPAGVTKDATLTLSPSSGSFTNGSNIAVAVRLNSPTQKVFSAQSVVTYPANQLQYVSVTNSATFSTIARTNTGTAGTIDIIRGVAGGNTTGFSGTDTLVTINFKVVGSSGTANLALTNGSGVFDKNGNNLLATTQGASYGIGSNVTPPPPPPPTNTTPPPPPPPPPTGSNPPSSQPPKQVISPGSKLAITPQTGGTASLNGSTPQVGGEVQLAPIIDPEILAENPADSIVKVEYYLQKKLVSTKTKPPFTYSFDTKKLRNGIYEITIRTYYQSGTIDTNSDSLEVKNPVTLSYVLGHYATGILATVIGLAIAGFIVWKYVLPRLMGNGALETADGYNGYDGYADPDAVTPYRDEYQAPDPAVITPSQQQTPIVTPEQAAATQTTEPLPVANQQPQVIQPTVAEPAAPVTPSGEYIPPASQEPSQPAGLVQPTQPGQSVQPAANPAPQSVDGVVSPQNPGQQTPPAPPIDRRMY